MELEAAGQLGHEKGNDLVVGRENELENDDEADKDGPLGAEAKGRVEDGPVHEHCEYEEVEEGVELADEQVLHVVVEFPVAELVRQDGDDFGVAAAFGLFPLLKWKWFNSNFVVRKSDDQSSLMGEEEFGNFF